MMGQSDPGADLCRASQYIRVRVACASRNIIKCPQSTGRRHVGRRGLLLMVLSASLGTLATFRSLENMQVHHFRRQERAETEAEEREPRAMERVASDPRAARAQARLEGPETQACSLHHL